MFAGRSIQADIIEPAQSSRGAVILAHGFMRSRENMRGHGEMLAQSGVLAVIPDLPSWDSRENAKVLAELVAQLRGGTLAGPVDQIVLVGFSSGALATLLAADSSGVIGYVGLDGFDRPGGVGLEKARTLRTPAVLLYGPDAFCNAYGIAAPWRSALPMLVRQQLIEGHSHCDFEFPTDRWCELACGGTNPARQQRIRDELRDAVSRLLPDRAPVRSPLPPAGPAASR
jgi:dienelactone hydrolase